LTWNLALSKPKPEFDVVPHAFGGDPWGHFSFNTKTRKVTW